MTNEKTVMYKFAIHVCHRGIAMLQSRKKGCSGDLHILMHALAVITLATFLQKSMMGLICVSVFVSGNTVI